MNIRRAILAGIILSFTIFILYMAVSVIPFTSNNELAMNIAIWILIVPASLLTAKWYFKKDPPNLNKGMLLGLIVVLTGLIIDLAITVPLMLDGDYNTFFSNWETYFFFIEIWLLMTFAGFEFDATYTESENTETSNDI